MEREGPVDKAVSANDARTPDEARLIEQAKTDPEVFGQLYEKYVERIYTYIYYRTSNHYDAEDLTARTFHRALRHLPRYEQRGAPFSAWLYRIAHNLVANWHRDRSRRKVIALDELALHYQQRQSVEGPEQFVQHGEEKAELLRVIRRLPADRQQLLILKFVEGLTNRAIGRIMRRSEGAIKSLYHRTLIALREEMGA
jgi:RNA polymerase sigma-70 factor (ECF subfamily)